MPELKLLTRGKAKVAVAASAAVEEIGAAAEAEGVEKADRGPAAGDDANVAGVEAHLEE